MSRCPKCGYSEQDDALPKTIKFFDGVWFYGLPADRQPYRDSIRTIVIADVPRPSLWSRIKSIWERWV